jgi:hypothetical protein
LDHVSISDPLLGGSPLTFAWPGAAGTLQPGQIVTATQAYAVTQADIDAGHVTSSATIIGSPPKGPPITPPLGHLDTTLTSSPVLEFSKTADASGVGDPARVGDVLTYTFRAKNAGDALLSEVTINDPMLGLAALVYAWPGAAGTLSPGQSVTATATYAVTRADIDAGAITNAATATGKTPAGGQVITPPASVVVTFPPVTAASADIQGTLPPVPTSSASAAATTPPVVPGQSNSSLATTGVVLTVLPVSVLVVGAGLLLFLIGRRKRSGA